MQKIALPWIHRPPRGRGIPPALRANFFHLYLDIAWFGVLSGSAIAFISVYLVRIGASAFQVGLVNAGPAIVALIFSLPAGIWLQDRRLDRAVFRSSVLFRFFYLFWIPLPLLLNDSLQISLYVGIIFLMSIPGTLLSVGFNAFFAEVVPEEWRGHVVGLRNAVLAATFMLTSLACGGLLAALPYPTGYQVVFAIGFLGAALSSLHLRLIRLPPVLPRPRREPQPLGDSAQPGRIKISGDGSRAGVGLRYLLRTPQGQFSSANLLRGPFGTILAVLFAYHFAQYLAIPMYPLYWVENLGLTDQHISAGNALFHGAMFVASTQLAFLTRRFGNHKVFALGAFLLVGYPVLTGMAQGLGLYFAASILGGGATALAGGAVANYLLEKTPRDLRPRALGFYVLALNAAILIASFGGSFLVGISGLSLGLFLAAGARLVSALIVWHWGR